MTASIIMGGLSGFVRNACRRKNHMGQGVRSLRRLPAGSRADGRWRMRWHLPRDFFSRLCGQSRDLDMETGL